MRGAQNGYLSKFNPTSDIFITFLKRKATLTKLMPITIVNRVVSVIFLF